MLLGLIRLAFSPTSISTAIFLIPGFFPAVMGKKPIKAPDELVIGIGDLHGHYPALESLLEGLQGKYHIFSGDFTLWEGISLVFTGDYIDRGDSALKIIGAIRQIAGKNPNRVKTLIGNHELLALEASDAAEKIAEELKVNPLLDASLLYAERSLHGYNGGNAFVSEFGANAAEAFENYCKRMSGKGDIGSWLRGLLPSANIEIAGKKILFTHGDLGRNLKDRHTLDSYLADYLDRVSMQTEAYGGTKNKYGGSFIYKRGVFWGRDFRKMPEKEIEQVVKAIGADFLVTGHTPHDSIKVYAGKVFDIDAGMCPAYGENEPVAIVFKTNGIYEFNAKRRREKLLLKF